MENCIFLEKLPDIRKKSPGSEEPGDESHIGGISP